MVKERFFAFGCSFTDGNWPTWADIVGQMYKGKYYNYGVHGGGNFRIFERLMVADQLHNINENDLVVIQWTNVTREDRWFNNEWLSKGNIWTHPYYEGDFIKKYADPLGYYIRDLSIIKAVTDFLKSRKCTYYMIAMSPLGKFEQWNIVNNLTKKEDIAVYNRVSSLYKNVIEEIRPDYFNVIYKQDWFLLKAQGLKMPSRKKSPNNKEWLEKDVFEDYHPTPLMHLSYLEQCLPEIIISEDIKQKVAQSEDILLSMVVDLHSNNTAPYWFDGKREGTTTLGY